MSMIAGVLILAGGSITAEQTLAAHRAATSIGLDRCRRPTGDEIVVCGRRESAYALPLYEPTVHDGSVSGRAREDMTDTMMDVFGECRARGEVCLKPKPVIRIPFGRGAKSGPVIGPDPVAE